MRNHPTVLQCALVLMAALAPQGSAALVTYSNPFEFYGTNPNSTCSPGGACGAAQAINSFVFLSNYYSGIYGNTEITTGNHTSQGEALVEFAVGNGTNGDICGYYSRFGANPCATNNGINQNYVDTKNSWLNNYAPNTTQVVSNFNGNQGANFLANFLGPELKDHEDIELFWYTDSGNGTPTNNVGHVITPTSVTYDPANPGAGMTMTYQDPNDPTHPKTVNATVNGQGYLSFTDAGPSNLGTVLLTAGFAESPLTALIPEPGTISLLLGPLAGLWLLKRRQSTAA